MKKRLLVLGILFGAFLLYLAPYYVLVLRANPLHPRQRLSDAELAERYQFPLRCGRGYALHGLTMRKVYDWWHDIDARLRYDYWHATSVEDLRANHTGE